MAKKIELNNPLIMPKVQVANSATSGRGVFAVKDFKQDELIEECHVVIFKNPRPHVLNDYIFKWDDDHAAMLLGNGCIYNHSKHPNAYYRVDKAYKLMNIFAKHDIKCGEEIYITYGEEWFESHQLTEKIPNKRQYPLTEILIWVGIMGIFILLFLISH